jgi:hypothetical protein
LGDMRCMVAVSREEARRWVVLRHTGSQDGVGVVGWSSEMQVRYSQNYSGQRGQAIRLTDALRDAYPNDQELHDLIGKVRTTNLTTLGRLVRDPIFRAVPGIDLSGDEVAARYPASALRELWHRVLSDLTTTVTARSLNKKEQRANYVDTLADVRPPPEARRPPAPLSAEPAFGTVPAASPRRPATRVQRPRPTRLFQGLALRSVSHKSRDIRPRGAAD